MKFNELPLGPEVLQGVLNASFTSCMSVQELVLPESLQGKDVMVQSKTGSGKTAVFILTVLQKYGEAIKNGDTTLPVALIIAPTRELAVQIETDAILLSSGFKDFRIGCFYGGVGYQKQDKQVEKGVDLIIGTPGRILDFQKMGKLNFKSINTFIIDEADRLFDMGFYPDIQKMFTMMVDKSKRQTMIFSATLSNKVRNLAWSYMTNPIEIENQPEEITVNNITQELYHISSDEKLPLLLRLLAKEDPKNCLIFTNTKAKAVEISKRLGVNGYTVRYLMGDLPQNKRLGVINRMKSGDLKFLVATDVAARGLQIDDLALVINYDIPEDFENYVHRIGRTARAGKSGKSITLACEEFVYGLEPIETFIQMKIPVIWPTEEELPLVEDKSKGMRFRDLVDQSEYASKYVRKGTAPYSHGKKKAQNSNIAHKKGSSRRTDQAPPQKRKNAPPAKRADYTKSPSSSPRGGKSYQDIQKMDLNERMEYYKNTFASPDMVTSKAAPQKKKEYNKKPTPKRVDPIKSSAKKESTKKEISKKNTSHSQKNASYKSTPTKEKVEPKTHQEHVVVKKDESKKKNGGFLSRLFGRAK